MMGDVESHLCKVRAETIACHHPVCTVEDLVFNSMMHLKNDVSRVYGILNHDHGVEEEVLCLWIINLFNILPSLGASSSHH